MGIEGVDGPEPIACSLTPADLRDRGAAWRRVLGSGLVKGRRVRGGVRLVARKGARATLLELVELERACCPWMGVAIEEDGVTLTSTSREGQAALALMFLGIPFLRLLGTWRRAATARVWSRPTES
jgi:hypothetical protein